MFSLPLKMWIITKSSVKIFLVHFSIFVTSNLPEVIEKLFFKYYLLVALVCKLIG